MSNTSGEGTPAYRFVKREFYHDACSLCGALVYDTKQHDIFHASLTNPNKEN